MNKANPLRTCRKCRRQYAFVRGYADSDEVCGVCLARKRRDVLNSKAKK